MKLAQKQMKATKKNSSFVSFVPFCSREIRVIRAICGKLIAKMSDSAGLQPGHPLLRTKGQQSGSPTGTRLHGRDHPESRLKIGAPDPKL